MHRRHSVCLVLCMYVSVWGWMCFCARKLELFCLLFFFIWFFILFRVISIVCGVFMFAFSVCAMCMLFLLFYDIYSIFSFAVIYFVWVWIFYAIINKIYAIDFGALAADKRGWGCRTTIAEAGKFPAAKGAGGQVMIMIFMVLALINQISDRHPCFDSTNSHRIMIEFNEIVLELMAINSICFWVFLLFGYT